MKPVSFARHRFPADIIRQAVWLYFHFTLSFRDVEDLMAQRGIDVSFETIQRHLISRRSLRYLRTEAMATWAAATASG